MHKRYNVGCLFYICIFVLALIVGIAALISRAIQDGYNSEMSELDTQAPPAAGACKLTSYRISSEVYTDEVYTEQYIPDDLLAKKPEEVAAVVYITDGGERYGTYGNGASAMIRTVTIQIFDLETQTYIAEETFRGGNPPVSIDADKRSAYGSYPDEDTIEDWIRANCGIQ